MKRALRHGLWLTAALHATAGLAQNEESGEPIEAPPSDLSQPSDEPVETPLDPEVTNEEGGSLVDETDEPVVPPQAEAPTETPAEPSVKDQAPVSAAPYEPARVSDSKLVRRAGIADTERRKPKHNFQIGYGNVREIGEYNHYEKLYGKPNYMLSFDLGYYLWTYIADLGGSIKFGYYNDKGHPLTSLGNLNAPVTGNLPDDLATDQNQRVELTLLPIQVLGQLAYSPFPVSRRIVFRGWFGPEFLYVQETLRPDLPDSISAPAGTSLVTKGWNQGLVTGASVSISLSGLEPRSDYALKSIGVDRVYLSPFYELVTTSDDKMGNYDRKTYGINLSFEGLR